MKLWAGFAQRRPEKRVRGTSYSSLSQTSKISTWSWTVSWLKWLFWCFFNHYNVKNVCYIYICLVLFSYNFLHIEIKTIQFKNQQTRKSNGLSTWRWTEENEAFPQTLVCQTSRRVLTPSLNLFITFDFSKRNFKSFSMRLSSGGSWAEPHSQIYWTLRRPLGSQLHVSSMLGTLWPAERLWDWIYFKGLALQNGWGWVCRDWHLRASSTGFLLPLLLLSRSWGNMLVKQPRRRKEASFWTEQPTSWKPKRCESTYNTFSTLSLWYLKQSGAVNEPEGLSVQCLQTEDTRGMRTTRVTNFPWCNKVQEEAHLFLRQHPPAHLCQPGDARLPHVIIRHMKTDCILKKVPCVCKSLVSQDKLKTACVWTSSEPAGKHFISRSGMWSIFPVQQPEWLVNINITRLFCGFHRRDGSERLHMKVDCL